ncbi:MAG TPA: twin-arginine translocase TatA/TatE family subunit [Solirubrobacteraceae bacterium]|nr:twin-arginine translocase TatA/TatE family subunit [Solirubrobacteraceae bacterium]
MGLDNPLHIAFLLIVLLLVFGARRLPEMGRSIGTGMREFKDAISGVSHEQPPMLSHNVPQPQPPVAQPVQQAQPQEPVAQSAPESPAAPTQQQS